MKLALILKEKVQLNEQSQQLKKVKFNSRLFSDQENQKSSYNTITIVTFENSQNYTELFPIYTLQIPAVVTYHHLGQSILLGTIDEVGKSKRNRTLLRYKESKDRQHVSVLFFLYGHHHV
jgi:hypothetical protein